MEALSSAVEVTAQPTDAFTLNSFVPGQIRANARPGDFWLTGNQGILPGYEKKFAKSLLMAKRGLESSEPYIYLLRKRI